MLKNLLQSELSTCIQLLFGVSELYHKDAFVLLVLDFGL